MTFGTTVKISTTTLVNGSGADSATIDITDPAGTLLVDGAAMTDAGSGEFTYAFASPADGEPGHYNAKVTALSGVYPGITHIRFQLEID
jgi:hypothetical protein